MPVEAAIVTAKLLRGYKRGAGFLGLASRPSDRANSAAHFLRLRYLYLDGYDLRRAPLIERKTALAGVIGTAGTVRDSEHFEDDGPRLLQHACRLGLEGVVSKLREAPLPVGAG